jgi:hypothetical protein
MAKAQRELTRMHAIGYKPTFGTLALGQRVILQNAHNATIAQGLVTSVCTDREENELGPNVAVVSFPSTGYNLTEVHIAPKTVPGASYPVYPQAGSRGEFWVIKATL